MLDGIYAISFRGVADWGMGLLVFKGGTITGADVGGIFYDGSYTEQADAISAKVVLTVPPGATLVQGTPPQPREYKIPFEAVIKKQDLDTGSPVLIQLPPGPVNVIFKRLRSL